MKEDPILVEGGWTSRQRRIFIIFLSLFIMLAVFLFIIFSVKKESYKPIPIFQTVGMKASSEFQFTLSPDNQWIIYLEEIFPYYDRHNIIAYNIFDDKKYTITVGERDSQLLRFGLQNKCWTSDSKYCFLQNEVYGRIDFAGSEPKFSEGLIEAQNLTCSDCGNSTTNEKFSDGGHGRQLISPDGRFIAEQISYGDGFVSPPKLYLRDTENNSKTFIASNVYYDMHFSSDSAKLYYYGCEFGGGCDQYKDHLFFISLNDDHRSSEQNQLKKAASSNYPKHTAEEAFEALEKINKEENNIKEATIRAHYDLLVEEFKQPQKIVGLQSNRLVTEDYYELALVWDVVLQDNVSVALSNFVETLIGEEAMVVMPSYEEFVKTYDGADKFQDYRGQTLYIHDGQGQEIKTVPRPTDPTYKKYMGIVRAQVYYEGELLNDKFK